MKSLSANIKLFKLIFYSFHLNLVSVFQVIVILNKNGTVEFKTISNYSVFQALDVYHFYSE